MTATSQATRPMEHALRKYGPSLAMIITISALHYLTPHGGAHDHITHITSYPWYVNLHGIYRRLYYFPIVLAAFRGGPRGGEMAALLVIVLYIPHATGLIGHDPGTAVEKVLEIALYLAMGLSTGILADRINAARTRVQQTAVELQSALDEKTAMEDELVRAARMAAVGRLSAGLAHEIRNPLASIQGSAEVLSDDFPSDHPKAGLYRIMLEETARLNQVLTRFLAFARNEPSERVPFDLATAARAVRDLVRQRPHTADIKVTGPSALMACGDSEQVRQILLNLALNGSAAAGPNGHVVMHLDRQEGLAVCRVCDTGAGFSTAAADNFGTPFFTTKSDGTGLGLATSVRLAEDLGGSLAIDPEHAGGACVVLKLPSAAAD